MKKSIVRTVSLIISVLIITACFSSCTERLETEAWQVVMPDIEGMECKEALKTLAENNLQGLVVDKINDKNVGYNCVVSQEPSNGKTVNKGTVVEIVLSTGGDVVFLPDFSYYKKEVAVEMLKDLGVNTKIVTAESDEVNPYVAPGAVNWTVPDPGKPVSRGSDVTVLVRGNDVTPDKDKMAEVPALIDRDYFEMVRVLADRNIFLSIKSAEYGDSVNENKITSQSEIAGKKIPEGSIIYVSICLGASPTVVPDVTYMTQEDAEDELLKSGLSADISYAESNEVAKGSVIKQKKSPGKGAESGERIGIVISSGCATEVPDVEGENERVAIDKLINALLEVEVVYVKDSSTKSGKVAAQSIEAEETVGMGTKVTVYVSSKKASEDLDDAMKENEKETDKNGEADEYSDAE